MRILTDLTKAELDNLTSQPTAKAKSESTTTNTDMVDRELERLKEKKAKLDHELLTADETKRQELQMQFDQVNMELTLKNNDTYRRQHSTVT